MTLQAIKQRFGIIGNSEGLNHALDVAMRIASTDLTVLILGESGVGKEVFSQIIHSLSARKHNQFIAVNCGAIPEGTIDSELFGHEKGAFTGASDKRKGYFESVNGGTIFLDEVGEMPVSTQARLLRVLESGEFIKVGSSKVIKTDVRVIAATNVKLLEAVRNGKFRQDLYYRLNTVPIKIPALRERKEDIYLLFRKFASDLAEVYRMPNIGLDTTARELLERYPWPGNIRELKNVAEQVSALSVERRLTAVELQAFLPAIQTNLPMLSGLQNKNNMNFSEREILYNILFEMRKDIGDLKQLIIQLLSGGNVPQNVMTNLLPSPSNAYANYNKQQETHNIPNFEQFGQNENKPYTIQNTVNQTHTDDYKTAEVVEESLSLADKEKELIIKALKKHKGKRKDAALDLGISERTLYRKIKDYHIE